MRCWGTQTPHGPLCDTGTRSDAQRAKSARQVTNLRILNQHPQRHTHHSCSAHLRPASGELTPMFRSLVPLAIVAIAVVSGGLCPLAGAAPSGDDVKAVVDKALGFLKTAQKVCRDRG